MFHRLQIWRRGWRRYAHTYCAAIHRLFMRQAQEVFPPGIEHDFKYVPGRDEVAGAVEPPAGATAQAAAGTTTTSPTAAAHAINGIAAGGPAKPIAREALAPADAESGPKAGSPTHALALAVGQVERKVSSWLRSQLNLPDGEIEVGIKR